MPLWHLWKKQGIATVIIPLGATDSETGQRLTVESVNEGKDYIEDADAVALFGKIVKTVEFNDVTVAANLLTKGYQELAKQKLIQLTIELNAVDLHLMDVEIERIKLGDSIRVLSEPHGLDEYMMVSQMQIDIANPTGSKILLGMTKKTLTDVTVGYQKPILQSLEEAERYLVSEVVILQAEIREAFSEIVRTADEIQLNVSETYASNTELESVQQNYESSIAQTASEITLTFMGITNEIRDTISQNSQNFEEYIRFRGALIELGKLGNAFTAQLSNEDLSFLENGKKIAYLSNQNLVITDTEIRNKLSLGNETRGWFDFVPRSTGNLSVKWREPTA